MKYHC